MYRWKPLLVFHHLTVFCGHWSLANRKIKYLICHVTPQNNLIERSSNFESLNSLCTWYQLAKFGGHRYCGSGDTFLDFQVIKQGDVIKASGDCNNTSPSR